MNDIEVYELYDVWYHPWWQHPAVKIVGLVLLALCAGVALWFVWRWLRPKKHTPYWQRALEQCAALSTNVHQLSTRVVYARLTTILKHYLTERYATDVRAITDQELQQAIGESPISDERKVQIQQLLTLAVPIKFAHQQPDLEQIKVHIALMESFIKQTVPAKEAKSAS